MSKTDTSGDTPQSFPSGGDRARPRRWRGIVFGTALFLVGGILGAVVASPGYGFGGWHSGPGWHGGPMGGGFGAMPGPVEWHVERVLASIDAKAEQREKIKPILERTADQLFALREQHLAGRKQMREALAAPTIDRARIEALRAEHIKLADSASRVVAGALVEAAEVLTPEQRAELARRMERRHRWFRG